MQNHCALMYQYLYQCLNPNRRGKHFRVAINLGLNLYRYSYLDWRLRDHIHLLNLLNHFLQLHSNESELALKLTRSRFGISLKD